MKVAHINRTRAKSLRSAMTDAERVLWLALRDRRLGGLKFRRQVPIAGYVADFYCASAMLVIELDGGQHAERQLEDAVRTRRLNAAGFRVLRFWNNDVLTNLPGVCETIAREAGVRFD